MRIRSRNIDWDLKRFGLHPVKWKGRILNSESPKIFCTAMPKAGTHLLERLLCLHPALSRNLVPTLHVGSIKKHNPIEALDSLGNGRILVSHLVYNADLQEAIRANGGKHIIIFRDPRDVVISDYFFIKKHENHHANKTISECADRDSAIAKYMRGIYRNSPTIGESIAGYQKWIPSAKVVYFEDLIGTDGKEHSQRNAIQAVFDYLGVPASESLMGYLQDNLVSADSPTFRKGKSGEWRKYFSNENKRLFKELAGKELIELGYESDMEW